MKSLNIKKVVYAVSKEDEVLESMRHIDPYKVAKDMGIYEEFEVENELTVEKIAERVVLNREKYKAKFEKKIVSQNKYYAEKDFVSEL